MKENNVKVTVYLSTYNQEKYISEALDSILMQKTDFDFEILAADDCSTDATQQIILDYQKKYPDKIVTYFTNPNVGGCQKLVDCINKGLFRGDYVSFLEGDDYWLDENRLQMLVDFLEQNPEYSRVSHRRKIIDQNGNDIGFDIGEEVLGKPYTEKDLLEGRLYSDFGSVFRNYYKDKAHKYDSFFLASRNVCDFQSLFITQEYGPVYIMDKCLGVYRSVSTAGASNYNSITTSEARARENIVLANAAEEFYDGRYDLTPMKQSNQQKLLTLAISRRDGNAFREAMSLQGIDYNKSLAKLLYLALRGRRKEEISFIRSQLDKGEYIKLIVSLLSYSVKRISMRLVGKRENELLRGTIRKN